MSWSRKITRVWDCWTAWLRRDHRAYEHRLSGEEKRPAREGNGTAGYVRGVARPSCKHAIIACFDSAGRQKQEEQTAGFAVQ